MAHLIVPTPSRVIAVIGVAVMALSGAAIAHGEDTHPVSYWMKKKLEYSQNILSGITRADFGQVLENAQSMRNLSKIEGFIRGQTPAYRTQLHFFEESADEIVRQAKKENVDGAALAFTQLTISCVNCHKQLREAK